MAKIERVYKHYNELEEYHAGMWKISSGPERKQHIKNAAELMRNAPLFKSAMEVALDEWVNSCLHNLSAENVNRIAWLGHAGCCIGVGSPEEATRAGWHTLSKAEQDEANRVAAEVLAAWDEANDDLSFFSFWGQDAERTNRD